MIVGLPLAAVIQSAVATGGAASPLVIAHRGASAYRPEHTLEAYRVAVEQGADFIEPDLVVSKDGVLIVRHENVLSATTNVADLPEFADRKVTKVIDGEAITDWFAEDFTLTEIKQLRAREGLRSVRSQNATYDDRFEIPTFGEVIDLVKQMESDTGKRIGVYPETKHPTYFAYEGIQSNGKPINRNLGEILVDTLKAKGFTEPDRIFIQSFEIANLIELKTRIMPRAGVDLPLVQLFGDVTDSYINVTGAGFSRPYDVAYHSRRGADMGAIYGPFLAARLDETTGYGDLLTAEVFAQIARYAAGIGPWTHSILLRKPISAPVDGDGDGRAEIKTALTGEVGPILALALDQGLHVHPYTLRPEEPYLSVDPNGRPQTLADEVRLLLSLAVSGFFTDDPLTSRLAVDAHRAAQQMR